MERLISTATALAASFVMLTPLAAAAQSTAPVGYYTATPTTTPTKTSLVTRNTVWKWRDTAYTANRGQDRDAILCELVVQRVGTLSAFTVAGQPFDAAALAKCNARAK